VRMDGVFMTIVKRVEYLSLHSRETLLLVYGSFVSEIVVNSFQLDKGNCRLLLEMCSLMRGKEEKVTCLYMSFVGGKKQRREQAVIYFLLC
jgi:hypothetical protein